MAPESTCDPVLVSTGLQRIPVSQCMVARLHHLDSIGLLMPAFKAPPSETKMGNDSSKPTCPPSPPAPSKELKDPWRPVKWSEKEEILKELDDLKPRLVPLRILLHGPVGAGKSCFINSVQRVLLGRNVICALESSTTAIQGESFTLSIKTHKMKKRGGGYYPFVFSDIMGLETKREGIQIEDIIKVLEGHILEGYKFNPRGSIAKDDKRYNPSPNLGDRIHCLVSIVPADTISRMDESVINKMRTIRKTASEWNVPQVIVLTKVDNACEIVSQDLRKLYHSKKIKEKVEVSNYKLGIPLSNIYPMKNYHVEITEDATVDVLILMALRDIVNFANDYVESMHELSDCKQS
ncbi:hypothetical protein MHYP_G00093230 [Metynnis hypsauchen]